MLCAYSIFAVKEKEEAEAVVKVAKTEVVDLWKAHDYLTSFNCTKVERGNHLDLNIRIKMSRSKSLDKTIDAKEKKIKQLEAKTMRSRKTSIPSRQNPMFVGMSAYIYRFDEGL